MFNLYRRNTATILLHFIPKWRTLQGAVPVYLNVSLCQWKTRGWLIQLSLVRFRILAPLQKQLFEADKKSWTKNLGWVKNRARAFFESHTKILNTIILTMMKNKFEGLVKTFFSLSLSLTYTRTHSLSFSHGCCCSTSNNKNSRRLPIFWGNNKMHRL